MGQQPEIITDAVATHLINLIETNIEDLSRIWKNYQPALLANGQEAGHGKLPKIYPTKQDQLPYDPAIEIIYDDTENNIFSIGTQEDRHNFTIIVTVTNANPTAGERYLRIMAKAIQDLLNLYDNRSFVVPGYTFSAYYTEATSATFGYKRGRGLRSAQIKWYCKLLKPNRFT